MLALLDTIKAKLDPEHQSAGYSICINYAPLHVPRCHLNPLVRPLTREATPRGEGGLFSGREPWLVKYSQIEGVTSLAVHNRLNR